MLKETMEAVLALQIHIVQTRINTFK